MENIPEKVRQMVMDDLHITYDPDGSTINRISNEISSGMAYIKKYCDPNADFCPGTSSGRMLCDYVLRAEAGALETFADDFAADITAAKIETDVNGYAEAMGYEKDQ